MKFNHAILPALLLTATLTGCKSSSDNNTVEVHHETGTASRLLVAAENSREVTVISVRNSEDQATLTLSGPVTGIYSSPASRYGLIAQADQVEVIDGGIYQVPHDGHFDTEVKDPSAATEAFIEEALVSYRAHESRAALIAQHSATELEVLNFDDHALEELFAAEAAEDGHNHAEEGHVEEEHEHEELRVLDLTRAALVEPRGDQLVVVYSAESSVGAGDQVEIHHYHEEEGEEAGYELEDTLTETCSNVQASFSLEHASVFACADGVLVISEEHEEEAQIVAAAVEAAAEEEHEHELVAEKIASDSAIDAFTASAHGHVVGAWSGNNLYVIDLEHEHDKAEASEDEELHQVDWNGAAADTNKLAAAIVPAAEAVVVLDDSGNLHVLTAHEEHKEEEAEGEVAEEEHEEHGYEYDGAIANVLSNPAANVQLVASPVSDEVFILDSTNNQIVVVHVGEKEVHERIDLNFAPAHIAWVGVADGETGHDHGEEEEGHGHSHD